MVPAHMSSAMRRAAVRRLRARLGMVFSCARVLERQRYTTIPSVSQFDLGRPGGIRSPQIALQRSGRISMSAHRTPEEIRKGLTHPVVDGDGHWVAYTPVFAEQIRKVTGDLGANGFLQSQRRLQASLNMTPEQRAERGVAMEGFWGRQSTNTRDRATAMMPRMLYDRLDELGIDFGVVSPTAGLGLPRIADDATRRAVIRGFNVVTHEYFKDLGDKLTPAAVIPVHTPEEAIEELTFVTKQLGAKVCMFGSGVRRPIPHAKGAPADLARYAQSFDQLGLDSEHDYDPLWQKCRELGIAPTFHTGGRSYGERNRPTKFTFNHTGHRVARSAASPRPAITVAAPMASATARPTSPSTTSVTSPRPATTSPRRCSSAGGPGASPIGASRAS